MVTSSQVAGGRALWLESMGCLLLPKQDITSLLHTIYEVVDSSVNHSPTSSKTLRVKLTVTPDGSQSKRSVLFNHTGESDRMVPSMGETGRTQVSPGGREDTQVPWTVACIQRASADPRGNRPLGRGREETTDGRPSVSKGIELILERMQARLWRAAYESGEVSGAGS